MKAEEAFISDLNASRRAVNAFAARMWSRGWKLWLPPARTRPDASERMAYADDGDMILQARIEHKARGLDFTSKDDYEYDTVIVDEVYKVDAKAGDPVYAYVIENRARTHAAVVYGRTRPVWTVMSRYDSAQGRECEFYVCPKTHVRFCEVDRVF